MNSFLRNRQQRLVPNGQSSNEPAIKAGFPQGSIVDGLFFLAYINDLPTGLVSNPKLFAADTSFQGFTQVVVLRSVFWRKKIDFYKGESDHETTIIAARGLWCKDGAEL